jgi:hypothetical protein
MRTIRAQPFRPDMTQHGTVQAQENKNDSKNQAQKWKGIEL